MARRVHIRPTLQAALRVLWMGCCVPIAGNANDAVVLEEVLVTGTRITNSNLVSFSPITRIDSEEILLSGITRAEDLLKNIPQVYLGQNASESNFASGTATVDLRSLGDVRTLVLVNSRRLPTGSPLTAGAADINQVPGALIERVEVLTGGASAVYGSDAMAGVVNFLLQDDFDGVQVDYQFSQYRHDNDNDAMVGYLQQAGYEVPGGTSRDGDIQDIAIIAGRNLAEERGNISGYLTYRDIDPISWGDRIDSACALRVFPDFSFCGGSDTIEEGLFTDFGLLEFRQGLPSYAFMVQGDEFVPWDFRFYNFAPDNYFQRADERYTAGLFGHYDIAANTEIYTEWMYMDDSTDAQLAASGKFHDIGTISCGNVLLSAQQFQVLCADYGLGTDDEQLISIGRRSVEGAPRRREISHESWRGVLGLRGDINQAWSFDVYGQYAEVDYEEKLRNDLSQLRLSRALDAVADPATGEPVCRSVLDGTDPDCVLWNIFREGGVTQAALDYAAFPISAQGETTQLVISGYLSGYLQEYGFRSPLADTGADFILGVEYREEELRYRPDDNARSGEIAGDPLEPLSGDFDVTEIYAELRVPLVEARPLAEQLALDLGYRYSDYSTGETTDTYKLAALWSPVESLRLRASFQHAVRTPNVDELYSPQFTLVGGDPGTDPCEGPSPARSFEECARSGVTAEQYGAIPINTSGGFNFLVGGNPELESEASDTVSVGFTWQPDFFDGVTLSVDWYEIEVEDAVNAIGGTITLENCIDTGAATFCDRVRRDPDIGDLWLPDGEGLLVATKGNLSKFTTEGYDVTLEMAFGLGDYGSLSINNILSYVERWDLEALPGEDKEDCVGKIVGPCLPAVPEVRNFLRATWNTPWRVAASALWRYTDELATFPSDFEVDAQHYLDLALLWEVTDAATLRLGVNNVFDEQAPLVPGFAANTLPGQYDVLGQYWFAGVSIEF